MPVCCPSRSSTLTGRYQHNTGVLNNSLAGHCSSLEWQAGPERKAFAPWVKSAGYRTFYAGKYLNRYGDKDAGSEAHIPPGWDAWNGLLGNSKYYNYALSVNGVKERYGHEESDYLTDVIANKALSFLNDLSPSDPFLMVLATPAPHAPFTPANRHMNAFANLTAPRTPSFNYVLLAEHPKHWLMNTQPQTMSDDVINVVDEAFRNRWRTLLAVDEMVDQVLTKIDNLGVLDNTFVVFTADHGYHLGQFALPVDKRQLYETDIRVPLMVRGPQIPINATSDEVVLNIDLAPTFLHMAGMSVPTYMDGKSFLPAARDSPNRLSQSQRSFQISFHGEGDEGSNDESCYPLIDKENMAQCSALYGCKCQDSRNNTYSCVRTVGPRENTIYCKFDDDVDFVEMYDLSQDPWNLKNMDPQMSQEDKKKFEAKIEALSNCQGYEECNIDQ